ncbi:MAG: PKD domain-containing protein [Verrucomicrobiales bacterium]
MPNKHRVPLSAGLILLSFLCKPVHSASLQEVEGILLPLYMGGFSDNRLTVTLDHSNLRASDSWWAMRSQRNMAIDEQVSDVLHLASHNGFNALGEQFNIADLVGVAVSPNQLLSMPGQLSVGSRLLELDIHDNRVDGTDGQLILKHGSLNDSVISTRDSPYRLGAALNRIKRWMDEDENRYEIVYIDIDDFTEDSEADDLDALIPKLTETFVNPDGSSMIFTPEDRGRDETVELGIGLTARRSAPWPSRLELLALNKRLIIFTHRGDSNPGRFAEGTIFGDAGLQLFLEDGSQHLWVGAGIAFVRDGKETPGRGVFEGDILNDVDGDGDGGNDTGPPAPDPKYFYAVQSDGGKFGNGTNEAEPDDIALLASRNVNFAQIDFLFTHDEDAALGNDFDNDELFQIWDDDEGRTDRLDAMVWSWFPGDPAVDRQIFQDLIPGDGTGAAQRQVFETSLNVASLLSDDFDYTESMDQRGRAARSNGRDYAVQSPLIGRWTSVGPDGRFPFALRSTERDPGTNQYRWRISTFLGSIAQVTNIPSEDLEPGDGFTYEFAAPIDGYQNRRLLSARDLLTSFTSVWINVDDRDGDGNWSANNQYPLVDVAAARPIVEAGTDFVLHAADRLVRSSGGEILFNYGASSDPDGDALFFDVLVEGFDTTGASTGRSRLTDLSPASPGSYALVVVAADGRGATTTGSAAFSIGASPEADAGGPYVVEEGGSIVLDASASTDEDSEFDQLSFEWDLDGDGHFDNGVGVSPAFDASAIDGPATIAVSVRVTDELGLSDIASADVVVTNVAPVILSFVSSSDTGSRPLAGDEVSFSGNFSDPGVADTHVASIDWGDGSSGGASVVTDDGQGEFSASHTFASGGVYTATVTLTDDDGGTVEAETIVYVTGAGIVDGVLTVVGTLGGDRVTINRQGNGLFKVHADFFESGNFMRFPADEIESIVLWLEGGDDHLNIAGNIDLSITLHQSLPREPAEGSPAQRLRPSANGRSKSRRVIADEGQAVVFAAGNLEMAEGDSYSWEHRSVDALEWHAIEGADSPVFRIDSAELDHAGDYRFTYVDEFLAVTSEPIGLSVQMRSVRIVRGGSLELAFRVAEGEEFSVETSRDLKTWLPANLEFVRDGDIMRATVQPDGEAMFFRLKP